MLDAVKTLQISQHTIAWIVSSVAGSSDVSNYHSWLNNIQSSANEIPHYPSSKSSRTGPGWWFSLTKKCHFIFILESEKEVYLKPGRLQQEVWSWGMLASMSNYYKKYDYNLFN